MGATPDAWPIERVSALDLMQLSSDAGSVPNQVGAVLVLDARGGFDAEVAVTLLGERLARVPRLRQRLVRVPLGSGRPIWVDDPRFELARHVSVVAAGVGDGAADAAGAGIADAATVAAGAGIADVAAAGGGAAAVLEIAAARVTAPLPRSQPLWSATWVTGLADDRVALVVVFHHVLADGIGGLAALGELLDGPADALDDPAEASSTPDFPRPPPTRRQLREDVGRTRRAASRRLRVGVRGMGAAARELGLARATPAPRTSLNRPTGPRRRVATVRVDLAAVRASAHTRGATVNDVVLTAVAGALGRLLVSRGERLDEVVVSVLVAPATRGPAGSGNRAGVMPVRLPTAGAPQRRLEAVAAVTRARKRGVRGSSTVLLVPLFRALATLGLLRWFMDHQRVVNIFVTNLPGPAEPVALAGLPVTEMQTVSLTTGNVTVAFAALSYAGTLTTTIVADADHLGDLDVLVAALRDEFGELVSTVEQSVVEQRVVERRDGAAG